MAKHRKHPEHEEHADESWLVPYADLLTLLLALFIVLFAASNIDMVKYNSIMEGLYESFHGNSPIDISTLTQGSGEGPDIGDVTITIDQPKDERSPEKKDDEEGETDDRAIQELKAAIEVLIHEQGLSQYMSLRATDEGVLVILNSDVWFTSGSATITESMKTIAVALTDVIAKEDGGKHTLQVIVTGHTDNLPISTAQFPSNWHLSIARAVNFMTLMVGNPELTPPMFSARGYGEWKPVASNDTEEGRQKNRRVEIYLIPAKTVAPASSASPAA